MRDYAAEPAVFGGMAVLTTTPSHSCARKLMTLRARAGSSFHNGKVLVATPACVALAGDAVPEWCRTVQRACEGAV